MSFAVSEVPQREIPDATPATSEPPAGPSLVSDRKPAVKALSLRRNFSWTLGGNVFYAGCQWLTLVAFTKLSDAGSLGRYGLALALTTPIFLLANLRLRNVQATDAKGDFTFKQYLNVRLLSTVAAAGISAVALLAFPRSGINSVIALVVLTKGLDSISDVIHGLAQRHERLNLIAISFSIKGLCSVIGVALALMYSEHLAWAAGATAFASGLTLVAFDVPICLSILRSNRSKQSLRPQPTSRRTAELTLFILTLPLGVVAALDSLWTNVPRYFVGYYNSKEELGIFVAIAALIAVGGFAVNALGQSALPRLALYHSFREYAAFDRLLTKLLLGGAMVGASAVIVSCTAGTYLLMLFYGAEYARHSDLLTWVMSAAAMQFVLVFCGTAITAMRSFKIQLPIHVGSLVIVTTCSAIFVPKFGMVGGAGAMIAANVFEGSAYGSAILWLRSKRGTSRAVQ